MLLLQSLREVLSSLRLFSDSRIEQKVGVEKLQDSVLILFGFLDFAAGKNLSKLEIGALLNKCLRCLVSYLEKIQVPITLNNIIQNVHLIEQAVDISFPGYAKSGLLRLIVRPSAIL